MRAASLVCAAVLAAASTLVGAAAGTGTAAACPAKAPVAVAVAVAQANHSRQGVLVPKGATALLLCRYHGLNPAATANRLAGSRLLTAPAQVGRIAAQLDALPAQRSGVFGAAAQPSAVHCPMDDGSAITARFDYPDRAAVTVDIGLSGCRTVERGGIVRSAALTAGSRLIGELERLTAG